MTRIVPLVTLSLLLAAGCASMPALQTPAGWEEVAPGVFLLRGNFVPGSQPDGNSVILASAEGLTVVDTGRHREHTEKIVAAAKELRRDVKAIVNTHWHLDHTGGNALLRSAYPDAMVYASHAIEGALTSFLANYRRQLEEQLARTDLAAQQREAYRAELAIIDVPAALRPEVPVGSSSSVRLAGRDVDLLLVGGAVTAGDVMLFDRATKTLIAGDLVTFPAPFFDTACPAQWQDALADIAEIGFQRLIPGHGPVMTRKDFETYRGAFDALVACGAKGETNDVCSAAWIGAVGKFIPEADREFTRMMVGYYLDNHLRGEAAQKNCR